MYLNIKTESTVLKMTLESGLVLNLQIPRPIQLAINNGSYWGGIGGNIRRQADLIEYIADTVHPSSDKEIITVLHRGETAPANPQKGDYWIDTTYNTLREYDGEAWNGESPDVAALYVTADTSHIYTYNSATGQFVDVTGEQVDGTINISSLDQLSDYRTNGMYKVCLVTGRRPRVTTTYYSLLIKRNSSAHNVFYTLSNENGYKTRLYDTRDEVWDVEGWAEYTYASEKYVQAQIEDLMPMIYGSM